MQKTEKEKKNIAKIYPKNRHIFNYNHNDVQDLM